MAGKALIDTGAILAIVDTSDAWHVRCAAAFRQLPFPLVTSEAVLTELFHLIGDHRPRKEDAWHLIRSGAIALSPIVHPELTRIQALMSRYWDRPMDFADATLVYLAERESIQVVFTVDQNDFATYRIGGRQRFQVVPVERA
jgi:predicted nucleic acid-binding protein